MPLKTFKHNSRAVRDNNHLIIFQITLYDVEVIQSGSNFNKF